MHAATDCITKYRGHQLLERRGGIAVPYPHYTAHERTSNGCERVLLHVFDTYASVRSIFERYFARATSSQMTSWSGKGVTSFTVLSFHCRASTTVLSLPFFLGMHSSGAACLTEWGSHHPAFT